MRRPVNTIEQATELRRRAEELARRHAPTVDPESTLPPWAVHLLHELRVHQIELEMQNEELRLTQSRLEEFRTRYFNHFDLAPIGYFTLSDSGVILEANLKAASRLGVTRSALVQQPFSRFLAREDQDSFYLHSRRLSGLGSAEHWDLRMVFHDGTEFWAHLDAVAGQDADGASTFRLTMSDCPGKEVAGSG